MSLRPLLARPGLLLTPGVFDGVSTLPVERAGYLDALKAKGSTAALLGTAEILREAKRYDG